PTRRSSDVIPITGILHDSLEVAHRALLKVRVGFADDGDKVAARGLGVVDQPEEDGDSFTGSGAAGYGTNALAQAEDFIGRGSALELAHVHPAFEGSIT